MAKDVKKGEDVERDGMISPLSYQGRKGGNPDSPGAEDPDEMSPRDPLGLLPKGATKRGKTGPGY